MSNHSILPVPHAVSFSFQSLVAPTIWLQEIHLAKNKKNYMLYDNYRTPWSAVAGSISVTGG